MEHVNASAAIRQQQQQHQSQQHQQFQQHQQEQQLQHEHQQQFCLRWHNHQTSLLSTLPILLDQSHLTDVTISAEGRTLRAHRVVLSACSTFFLELFRTLDSANHPVIIIPGASFAAIVALLTFMYSGEVNVYEEQIPLLLSLAETLGIKGLADVQNNLQKSAKRTTSADFAKEETAETPPSPASSPPPVSTPVVANTHTHTANSSLVPMSNPLLPPSSTTKLPTPLESFFLKSLQFYPHMLPQPLNFSQTALNKTTELLAKYQQQCNIYQGALSGSMAGVSAASMAAAKDLLSPQITFNADEASSTTPKTSHDDAFASKRLCSGEKKLPAVAQQQQQQHYQHHQHQQQQQPHQLQQQQKDIKRIDRIVENLRCGNKTPTLPSQATTTQQQQQQHHQQHQHLPHLTIKTHAACNYNTLTPHSPHKPPPPPLMTHSWADTTQQQHQQQPPAPTHPHAAYITAEEHAKLQQHMTQYVAAAAAVASRNTPNIDMTAIKSESSSASASSSLMSLPCEKLLSAPTTPTSVAASMGLSSTTPASPGQSSAGKPPSNSKLYATCFICHKQLSNQYNLRVHLETHQNVRYACQVCSHVSRSKDALRKHVSYRHPGAPSPCEMESRRKRASKALNANAAASAASATTAAINSPTTGGGGGGGGALLSTQSAAALNYQINAASGGGGGGGGNLETGSEAQMSAAAAQLSNAYMFLPNQFHLAAAAAVAAQQKQQEQQQQQQQQQQEHNFQAPTTATTAAILDYGSTDSSIATATTTTTTTSATAAASASATSTAAAASTYTNASNGDAGTPDAEVHIKTEYSSPPAAAPLVPVSASTDSVGLSCGATSSVAP